MMRVGVLLGGFEHGSEIRTPPAQKLRVVDFGGEIIEPPNDLRSVPH